MAATYEDVAKQFVEFYYNTFDEDREALKQLYRLESTLTFESESVKGADPIKNKLVSLPFKKVKHQVATLDAQDGMMGSVVILVTGALLVEGEERPLNYTQTFQLAKDASGQYFVLNDVFKIMYV